MHSHPSEKQQESPVDVQTETDEIISDAKASRGSVTSTMPDDAYFIPQEHKLSKSIQMSSRALFAIAVVLSLLVVFYPKARGLTPWIAVAFISIVTGISIFKRDVFALLEKDSPSNRVNLFEPFVLISMTLCFRGLSDYPDTNYDENSLRELLIGGEIAAVISLAIFSAIRTSRFGPIVGISFFLSFFLVHAINAIPPFREEVVHRGKIVSKDTSSRPRSYSIVIKTTSGKINAKTSRARYEKYRVGDFACVKEKIGRLGLTITH